MGRVFLALSFAGDWVVAEVCAGPVGAVALDAFPASPSYGTADSRFDGNVTVSHEGL